MSEGIRCSHTAQPRPYARLIRKLNRLSRAVVRVVRIFLLTRSLGFSSSAVSSSKCHTVRHSSSNSTRNTSCSSSHRVTRLRRTFRVLPSLMTVNIGSPSREAFFVASISLWSVEQVDLFSVVVNHTFVVEIIFVLLPVRRIPTVTPSGRRWPVERRSRVMPAAPEISPNSLTVFALKL